MATKHSVAVGRLPEVELDSLVVPTAGVPARGVLGDLDDLTAEVADAGQHDAEVVDSVVVVRAAVVGVRVDPERHRRVVDVAVGVAAAAWTRGLEVPAEQRGVEGRGAV